MEYAIVVSGGKQYKVVPGEILQVDKLPIEIGKKVVLDEVLFISDGKKKVTIGTPQIKGAKVETTVADQIKGPKTPGIQVQTPGSLSKATGSSSAIYTAEGKQDRDQIRRERWLIKQVAVQPAMDEIVIPRDWALKNMAAKLCVPEIFWFVSAAPGFIPAKMWVAAAMIHYLLLLTESLPTRTSVAAKNACTCIPQNKRILK